MNALVWVMLGVLTVWMIGCAYCGYRRRYMGFLVVLVAGVLANIIWMTIGLDARLTEPHVLMALVAGCLYGACAFGVGMLAGRLVRQWRATAVDSHGV